MSAQNSAPASLQTPTLSQIAGWDTDHLTNAASAWRAMATRWRDKFSAINDGIVSPGGTPWTGTSADAASMRSDRDRTHVFGLADRLTVAAAIAETGANDLYSAKSKALLAVASAQQAGFVVGEDLSVRDGLRAQSKPLMTVRQLQSQIIWANIQAHSLQLVATDQAVANRLQTFIAGFGNTQFPQSPTKEPAPPKVPMPPYQPRVWGACALGGRGDPNKVVRTFYRAPLVAGVSAMPSGDSVLYCGNDKFGFYHIVSRHGDDWNRVAMSRFPGAGNWRYLADYAISATLADPEKVDYKSGNDTFVVQRNIYRITESGAVYAFTCRVVVSGTDGKIITAYPMTTPI
ncbi:putative uncharacterized protein [Mycolicibacterium brisbanense]|uniref:Uncharacterized protein n=2 Tax=Mycolicibacterium brisbanense TaxID=146020 RepID=A0A117I6K7_9MYCO|nr:putative uncharacterized protein [Mycolicibacterium brisbanense]